MTYNFFEFSCFLVAIRDFEGSEWVFSNHGSKIRAKKLKINLGNPPKVFRQAPYQLAVFCLTFEPKTLETQSRALKTRILP